MVVEPVSQRAIWQMRPALQTQTLLVHVVPAGHGAVQVMELPQPSPTVPPQYWPPAAVLHVSGTQLVSPLHGPVVVSRTWPAAQSAPQTRLPPQPLPTVPQ